MAEQAGGHFRDFTHTEIDPVAQMLCDDMKPRTRAALGRVAGHALMQMGATTRSGGDGQRWAFPYGDRETAVVDMFEPETVLASWLVRRDTGMFYSLTGRDDGRGPLWLPNEVQTTVPQEARTGDELGDGLFGVAQALLQRTADLRRIGQKVAWSISGARDTAALKRWHMDPAKTKAEIWAHYDIDPRIYTGSLGFLDTQAQYSSGLLLPGQHFESLNQLQETKIASLLRQLQLEDGQRVLEIGSGWGGLAVAIAKAKNVHVTSLTLSKEQRILAQERAAREGVADRVEFVEVDYRHFQPKERFDRLVSVEMIEAVDWRDLGVFFDAIDRFVDPVQGVAAIQAITVPDKIQEAGQRHVRTFGNTAIFPGGRLASVETIREHMERRKFRQREQIELGSSYVLTLREWRRNFAQHFPVHKKQWLQEGVTEAQIERFHRGWLFYLASCQAGFSEGTGEGGRPHIGDQQISFARAAA